MERIITYQPIHSLQQFNCCGINPGINLGGGRGPCPGGGGGILIISNGVPGLFFIHNTKE